MTLAPPELIDIGANLGHDNFEHDLEEVLSRASNKGINTIVVTGTSVKSSHKAASLASHYPGTLYSTAGVHPHDASHFDAETPAALKALALLPQVKAIGETGLDFFRNFSPTKAQEEAFEAQLALAAELNLPAFLHQRDAHDSFFRILKKYRIDIPKGVVHCFTGSRDELHDYLELDMHIGITGWVCDERRGKHLHDFLQDIPLNRLMIETDAPYLLPRTIKPKPKSRRNEPENLSYVLKTVADILQLPSQDLAKQTTSNARDFFGI